MLFFLQLLKKYYNQIGSFGKITELVFSISGKSNNLLIVALNGPLALLCILWKYSIVACFLRRSWSFFMDPFVINTITNAIIAVAKVPKLEIRF